MKDGRLWLRNSKPLAQISKQEQHSVNYNSLNNLAYRFGAESIIPKIIHQIWLSDSGAISPVRLALSQTLKTTNPDYKYLLWR